MSIFNPSHCPLLGRFHFLVIARSISPRSIKFLLPVLPPFCLSNALSSAPLTRLSYVPGAGESGKSTIVKQMKIIHQNGFTNEELMGYRPTIYRNTVDSAQAIVLAMRKINVDCISPLNRVRLACLCTLAPPLNDAIQGQCGQDYGL